MIALNNVYVLSNKKTKEIICSGKIKSIKLDPINLVSFDNKYFFNINKKELFELKRFNISEKPFDPKIVDYLCGAQLSDILYNKNFDYYVDYDETELDYEIISLVNLLNSFLGFQTYSSCSGHSKRFPWIIFSVQKDHIDQLIKLIYIFNKKFNGKFLITSTSIDGDQPKVQYNISLASNIIDNNLTWVLQIRSYMPQAKNLIDQLIKYINICFNQNIFMKNANFKVFKNKV